MFCSSPRRQLLDVAARLGLVLGVLLVACSETPRIAAPSPSPTPSPQNYSCAQPQPAPGKRSLAGLAYGPAHTGQDPNHGSFPTSEEIETDMPTLASLTH